MAQTSAPSDIRPVYSIERILGVSATTNNNNNNSSGGRNKTSDGKSAFLLLFAHNVPGVAATKTRVAAACSEQNCA